MTALEASIVVDAEAPVGQWFTVAATLPPNTTWATISVNAPNGIVWWSEPDPRDQTIAFRLRVTQDWGFGRGYAELTWRNATGAEASVQDAFEVTCPLACQMQVLDEEVQRAVAPVYALTFAVVFLAVLFAAHAAHVYAVNAGEPTWAERLGFFLRSRIARDPMGRAKRDPVSVLPEYLHEEFQELNGALEGMDGALLEQRRVRAHVTRARRHLRAAGLLDAPAPSHDTPLPRGAPEATPVLDGPPVKDPEAGSSPATKRRRWPFRRKGAG